MSATRLPQLMDAKAIREELGITRAASEAIFRQLPKVTPRGLRKVYVRRDDVQAYIDENTRAA